MSLQVISTPIKDELEEFDKYFKSLMKTDVALLDLVLRYLTKKKPRKVRALRGFLLDSAKRAVRRYFSTMLTWNLRNNPARVTWPARTGVNCQARAPFTAGENPLSLSGTRSGYASTSPWNKPAIHLKDSGAMPQMPL